MNFMKVINNPSIFNFDTDEYSEEVVVSRKLFKDIKNIYVNADNVSDDTEMYHVYMYTKGTPTPGNLNWGMTVMHPVYVNGECNMTRGHWHENRECVEYYYGVSGHGLLMLMDEEGNTWAEEVFRGSLHHIDGHLAHRLVNTSNEDMKVLACWGCDAGHDYAAVEKMPFGYRVFKEDENLKFTKEKNNEK